MKTFLISIPPNNLKTALAFEDVFVQLHETLTKGKASFEIVASGQNVAFCFSADKNQAEVVIGQVYAASPEADIVEIADVTRNLPDKGEWAAAEISLRRVDLFPLKDYRSFDGDSLAGVLSVLSKCIPGESAFVQLVIKPIKDTGFHHFKINIKKRLNSFYQLFRVKYWFKRGVVKTFAERINEKTSGRLFGANLRVACVSSDRQTNPNVRLNALISALTNFNTLDLNQLRFTKLPSQVAIRRFQNRTIDSSYLLSTKELAALFHLPSEREVPNIVHVLSKKEAPPTGLPTDLNSKDICFFGLTNFRGQKIPFGIKRAERRRHLYVVGKSGSGKSKLLELLIKSDIESGHGLAVLDPHGDLVDSVLPLIPKSRVNDIVLFDPSDLRFPPSFNPLEQVPEALKLRVSIGFIEIFKKLFGTNWSPRLEHVLRYTTLALLDTPGTTILSILKMLTDKGYRQGIVKNIRDNVVRNFWINEFASWSEKFDNEAITPLLNKVGQFVATNMIRNIVGQPTNLFDFRSFMDNRKILLMKISKGILGEENASLLGAIAVTKMYQAAMSRADTPEEQRQDFHFYVDEFQNFATATFGEMLSEARKYRLNITLTNQFLGQLDPSIRKTVFGNVGSVISFRLGGEDAALMASEFVPRFSERDIINLGVRDFCIKMSIDGDVKDAFSGRTITVKPPSENYVQECIAYSRANYSRPVEEVRHTLQQWEESKSTNASPSHSDQKDFDEPLI